jgi:hypothetical protein
MPWPSPIQKILDLHPPDEAKPFDFLQRGKPVEKGIKSVSALEAKEGGKDGVFLLKGALYLYFDGFEEAHQIAQDHEGVAGNWIHAFLHRREPDAGNSLYWYRRTAIPKPISLEIVEHVRLILGRQQIPGLEELKRKVGTSKLWVPKDFVNLADHYREEDPSSPAYRLLTEIQQVEWKGLLKHLLASLELPVEWKGGN